MDSKTTSFMKHLLLLPLAALLMLTMSVSCSDKADRGAYSLADISDPTPSDSLMFYLGQLRASKFWRDAATDSALRIKGAQEDYVKGIKDALEALDRPYAYLVGLLEGAQMAENIHSYSVNYGHDFNIDIMLRSMRSALAADSVTDLSEIRRNFYSIRNLMEIERDERDNLLADEALSKAGEELGMRQLTPDLWKKEIVQGSAEKVERGDRVQVAMQLRTRTGQKIPIRLPSEVILGTRVVSTVLTDALLSMHYGAQSEFATTALALFGSHADQLDLHPESVLIITIAVLGELPIE